MRVRFFVWPVALLLVSGLVLYGGQPVHASRSTAYTAITIDGSRAGPHYFGVGAISGGGGNSRLLIDYPDPARSRILDYLFKPHFGAGVQLLKLEIGGDSNSTDGAEPSIEQSQGTVNCNSGSEWWLAEQAVQRNPTIKLYGLQWGAPGWVSSEGSARAPSMATSSGIAAASPSLWTKADVHYVLAWLGCAKAHGLSISYLGGWNERFDPPRDPAGVSWYERMRTALNTHGYRHVKLVAADSISSHKWDVADVMAADPAFNAAVDVMGVHDSCGWPPDSDQVAFGYRCSNSTAARHMHKPMWASEDGRMDANLNAATLIRELLNGYNQSGITGVLVYPLLTSMVDDLPQESRGMVTAKWPWSGQYAVNKLTWTMAQLTQFVPQGWNHVNGANRALGTTGSYNTFESPHRQHWSLVAQNTGAYAGQTVATQTLKATVKGALNHGTVHVWATDLASADPSQWFRQLPDVHPSGGRFTYRIPAGTVVTFTNRSAIVRRGNTATATAPGSFTPAALPSHYSARPDAASMPRYLSPMDGAFLYQSCLGDRTGSCPAQTATQPPVYWTHSSTTPRRPYAVLGDDTWANYTVGSDVLFTASGSSAGLIGRFNGFNQANTTGQFGGYEFTLDDDGSWALYRNTADAGRTTLTSGIVTAPPLNTWHRLALDLEGSTLTPTIDGQPVATITDTAWIGGLAGIESNWSNVQYDNLTIN